VLALKQQTSFNNVNQSFKHDTSTAFNQFKTKILVVVLCDMQITSPKQFSPKTTPSGY
jgi:hypothetical protein